MLVEKRVAGIIRWLERLKKSYSSGALESALMDAECARADLENLRLAVWEKVKPEKKSRPKLAWKIAGILKPVVLAAVIILVAVAPISRDLNSHSEAVSMDEIKQAYTEKSEVQAIKEQKTSARTQRVVTKQEFQASSKTQQVSTLQEAQASQKKSAAKKSQVQTKKTVSKPAKETVSSAPEKTVAYDKVFSLMQTGQRALKNNNSVVKFK